MSDNDRQDSWLEDLETDPEPQEDRDQPPSLPRRPAQGRTPLPERVIEKRYIKFSNAPDAGNGHGGGFAHSGESDDTIAGIEAGRGRQRPSSTELYSAGATGGGEEVNTSGVARRHNAGEQGHDLQAADDPAAAGVPTEDDLYIPGGNVSGPEVAGMQRARVYNRTIRGPNLNNRMNRGLSLGLINQAADGEFDWLDQLPQPPTPTPPPPPRKPSPPPPPPEPETPEPEDVWEPSEETVQREADEYDNEVERQNAEEWAGKNVTKWVKNVVVSKTQRAIYKENTEQLQQGLAVVQAVTKEPLITKFFSRLQVAAPYIVFALSILASLVDMIVSNGENARFSVTCFMFDITEIIFMTLIILMKKSKWYKQKPDEEREDFEKKKQIMDNILAEVLLYPTMLCSVVGIATGRNFLPENLLQIQSFGDWMGKFDLLMLTYDVVVLTYVYGTRIYMLTKFFNNLAVAIPDMVERTDCFPVTKRAIYTVSFNVAVFAFLIVMLTIQIYHENLEENLPANFDGEVIRITAVSGFMFLAVVVTPLLSIVVWALANYYYVLELMIKVNLHVVKNSEFRESLNEDYGEMAKGVVGFAEKNVHATPGRLRDIQKLTLFQRAFYVLREWWIDLIFFIWATIIVSYCYLVYSYIRIDGLVDRETGLVTAGTTDTIYTVYVGTFLLLVCVFLYANYHSFSVVMVTNVLIIPLFFSYSIQALMDFVKKKQNAKVQQENLAIAEAEKASSKYTRLTVEQNEKSASKQSQTHSATPTMYNSTRAGSRADGTKSNISITQLPVVVE